jgi:hypothetical protein
MRTKALTLTAVFCALGLATASAQAVYSVNVVGYINVEAPNGFSILANQLDNGNGNRLGDLLPTAPDGATVYKFTGAGFDIVSYDELDAAWSNPNLTMAPGEAAFFRNPGAPVTLTFVGEVRQGALSNELPAGFSMKSSIVPQAGSPDQLGLQGADGDTIYLFRNGGYVISSYDELDEAWSSPVPDIRVGEGFWFRNAGAARQWNRDFSVNN